MRRGRAPVDPAMRDTDTPEIVPEIVFFLLSSFPPPSPLILDQRFARARARARESRADKPILCPSNVCIRVNGAVSRGAQHGRHTGVRFDSSNRNIETAKENGAGANNESAKPARSRISAENAFKARKLSIVQLLVE